MTTLRRIALSFLAAFATLHAQPVQQHLVLVIIDGARYSETLGDPLGQYAPRMHQLAAVGAVVDTFLCDSLTYTQRAIPAIWCGTWVAPVETTIAGSSTQYTKVPTLWEYFRKDLNRDSTDALYELKELSSPWLPSFHPQYGPAYWPWYDMNDWSDLYVWQNARARLAAYHPTLTVLYLADVDHAGHSGVWLDYTRAITIADSIVGMLWDFVQSDTIYRNTTTVMVTNDHGRHLDGVGTGFVGHGDACAGCRRIELLAVGRGVKQTLSGVRRRIPDVTPTIGALLGFSAPFSSGSAMAELLKPIFTCTPDSIAFGDVGLYQSVSESLWVFNSGGVDMHVAFDADPLFEVAPAISTVPPRQGRGFRVVFTPDVADTITGVIRILHDDTARRDSIVVHGRGRAEATVMIDVAAQWNLLSLPITATDMSAAALFPGAVSPPYAFMPGLGYVAQDTMMNGRGYWVKFPAAQSLSLAGGIRWSDTIGVHGNWNLIGCGTFPVEVDSILEEPPGLLTPGVFGFDGRYFPADTLFPGRGYWVKAGESGRIILP